ncbi:hypothetical protein ACGFSB_36275 [Streptomyces sp. NPDC048441]|uniref:hypothetical protein n=1 Tax=Streptomyces sp. NPDC048441 TaxID=3365552 RepID=UPI00371939CA
MWPGQQPPGGEQNPQDQNPNPYQQPGYQQPNPYQQPGYQQQQPHSGAFSQPEQAQWAAPTPPPMPPQPGGGQGGGGNKTKITAIVAALAVVVAAGVTGFLVLGGDKDDEADSKPEKSPSKSTSKKPSPSPTDDGGTERGTGGGPKPTIPGWKVVVNPKWGTAFDVPADWEVSSADTLIGFDDRKEEGAKSIIIMSAPAILKEKWCTSDDDKDGEPDDTSLAAVGTKGQNGAKDTAGVARNDSAWWVYGGYTEQTKADKKKIKISKVEPYTTDAGIKGSLATSTTSGAATSAKCDSEGKATTFAFKNGKGEYVAWTLYGAKGVKDEVSESQVKKILSTVRLSDDTPESE